MTLEAELAARMLAFERKQAVTKNRNGNYLRPALPCDLGAKIGELNAQQIAIVKYLKKVGPSCKDNLLPSCMGPLHHVQENVFSASGTIRSDRVRL